MAKNITVNSCRECPYLRYPWNCAISETFACGNSFGGKERPKDESYWLGGNALPGDRLIDDIDEIPNWCRLLQL